nr:hypothetical protein [Tanacetum cinerariifolium]
MATLTFADTHNIVAYLSKSDVSAGFDQIMDFLNAHAIQYALVVNPTIYVSCIKQFWASVTIKMVNDAVQLRALIDGKKVVVTEDVIRQDLYLDDVDGVECFSNEEIFAELARMGYEKPPPKLTFYKAFFSTQWKFLIRTLVQCVSAKRTAWNKFGCSMASAVICLATGRSFNFSKVGKGFLGVETSLFASMLIQPQPQAAEEKDKVEMPTAPAPPSPTSASSPPPQDPTPTPHEDASKHRGKIESIDVDEDITLVDVETQVDMDAELQGRIDQHVSDATKDVSAAEPTVFDDEEVTMTMAQTIIKMKAKKAKLIDEQIAKRLHDEEVEKAAARKKQEKDDLERAQVLQKQKYQSLKKKPVSIAQARKNRIIYLKNMAGYKMEHFRGMTYDKVRPIFEREYKKVQTLFKPDKDVEAPQKKRVAEETLLRESFKKLKAVEVSGSESTQETPSNDPKEMSEEDVQNMLEIVLVSEFKVEALQVKVGGITEAYQSFKDMLKGFDKEDLVALWSLVKEKFSSAVPSVDKEKALWVELKRLFEPDADDVLWKLQRHDMFMLTEKDYPLSNEVMTLMLSAKLQVEEDSEMARDLMIKIFMEANKPKSRSLDTSPK